MICSFPVVESFPADNPALCAQQKPIDPGMFQCMSPAVLPVRGCNASCQQLLARLVSCWTALLQCNDVSCVGY